MVVKFFMMQAHYRSTLDFSNEALTASEKGYKRLMEAVSKLETCNPGPTDDFQVDEFIASCYEAMNDDFNTPIAIACLFDLVTAVNRDKSSALARQLKALGGVIGLLGRQPQAFLQGRYVAGGWSDEQVSVQIAARAQAKKDKQFADADRIRAELLEQGIVLEDKPGGITEWRRA